MKSGDRIRCVDAKEVGIPIKEGEIYTVDKYYPPPHDLGGGGGDGRIEDRANVPGVTLVEKTGVYMATRFEVVQ